MAVSSLHVIREHPVNLSVYENFLKRPFISCFQCVFSLFLQLSKNFFPSWRWDATRLEKIPRIDYVFISHLVSRTVPENKEDFYFGSLVSLSNSVLALINQTGSPPRKAIVNRRHVGNRLVLGGAMGFRSEIRLLFSMAKEFFMLLSLFLGKLKDPNRNLYFGIACDALSGATLANLRINGQIRFLLNLGTVSTLVATYEGYAWERLVFALKEKFPKTRFLGYQHAALFKRQHAAKRTLFQCNPDLILTAGQAGMKQLDASFAGKIPVKIIGSNRSFSNLSRNPKPVCLVVPEGIVGEVSEMLEFSVRCALRFTAISFVIRLHPLIDLERDLATNPYLDNLPGNVCFSDRSLSEDLEEASWVLYRGSTTVISVVANGVLPIRFSGKEQMDYDPLHEISYRIPKAGHVSDFGKIIASSFENDPEIMDYCREFYLPLRKDVFFDLLKN